MFIVCLCSWHIKNVTVTFFCIFLNYLKITRFPLYREISLKFCSHGMNCVKCCAGAKCHSLLVQRMAVQHSKPQYHLNSLPSCLGPQALICWLPFLPSHCSMADLVACTFCCHLKGISCHAPNGCTCLWKVFGQLPAWSCRSRRRRVIFRMTVLCYFMCSSADFILI